VKKFNVGLFTLALALAIGYLLGTERGRAQRDQILIRVRPSRGGAGTDEVIDLVEGADRATATAVASTDF